MSWRARRNRAVIRRSGAGLTVSVRRTSTLKNKATGAAPTLTVQSNGDEDDTTITLVATSLSGRFPAGGKFQLAGHVETYVVSTEAQASGGAIVLTFAPGLEAAILAGAAATITQKYGETSYDAMVSAQERQDNDGIQVEGRQLHLAVETGKPAPKVGDLLDTGEYVHRVRPVGPAGAANPERWQVDVGEERAA